MAGKLIQRKPLKSVPRKREDPDSVKPGNKARVICSLTSTYRVEKTTSRKEERLLKDLNKKGAYRKREVFKEFS